MLRKRSSMLVFVLMLLVALVPAQVFGQSLAQLIDGAKKEGQLILSWGTGTDRKSTRLNSSHIQKSRMPSSA